MAESASDTASDGTSPKFSTILDLANHVRMMVQDVQLATGEPLAAYLHESDPISDGGYIPC